MASFITNLGLKRMLEYFLAGTNAPTGFTLILITAGTPTVDTATISALTEHANAGGYTTGGITIEHSGTGWPTIAQDDANDRARATMKTGSWSCSAGAITAATWAILRDDDLNVIACFDLGGARSQTQGSPFEIASAILSFDHS